ncbi:recombinase family protein, partial [Desulfofundulus sp.]|uniref:recombinase family protein n=1 Tax=Desulfofundulus sp. TaxID=2282750 RepID=UPI003C78BE89
GGKWNGERVYSVLTQPAYAGDWYFKHRSKEDPSGWVRVPVPPIIDRATFERAQELLKERRNMIHRTTPREYLLRGLVKCRRCGWNMGGNTDDYYRKHKKKTDKPTKRAFYYRCLRNISSLHYPERNLGRCDAPWVRGMELEESVLKLLTEILSNPERLKEAIGQQDEATARAREKAESRIRELEKLIARAENEKDRLLAAYREGIIELLDLSREMDRIKARRQELLRELEEVKLKLTLEEDKVESIERLVEQYRGLSAEGLLDAPYEVKREFLTRLVQTIWVDTREDGSIQLDIECVIPGIEPKENASSVTPLASNEPPRIH